MSEPAVQVQGLRQAGRALKRTGDELGPALKEVGLGSAKLVAETGAALAPHESGVLARTVRAAASLKGASVRAGGRRAPGAPLVHFGAVRDKRTGRRRNIRSNPFLYDALDARRGDVVRRYEAGLVALTERSGEG